MGGCFRGAGRERQVLLVHVRYHRQRKDGLRHGRPGELPSTHPLPSWASSTRPCPSFPPRGSVRCSALCRGYVGSPAQPRPCAPHSYGGSLTSAAGASSAGAAVEDQRGYDQPEAWGASAAGGLGRTNPDLATGDQPMTKPRTTMLGRGVVAATVVCPVPPAPPLRELSAPTRA